MTTPIAGFPSITALAQAQGLRVSTAWKRISSLRCQGLPVTAEAIASWTPPPRKKREPSPVKRALMRGACTALARRAGCTPGAMRERLRRGQTLEQAMEPRAVSLSQRAREKGINPALAHQRRSEGASAEEALAEWTAAELITAAARARPGKLHGAKQKSCAVIRRHLAAGLTLAEALDVETAAAWARIEGRAA